MTCLSPQLRAAKNDRNSHGQLIQISQRSIRLSLTMWFDAQLAALTVVPARAAVLPPPGEAAVPLLALDRARDGLGRRARTPLSEAVGAE